MSLCQGGKGGAKVGSSASGSIAVGVCIREGGLWAIAVAFKPEEGLLGKEVGSARS